MALLGLKDENAKEMKARKDEKPVSRGVASGYSISPLWGLKKQIHLQSAKMLPRTNEIRNFTNVSI